MSNELQIAVIDDTRLSSHNLQVQLKFLGEQPVMTNSRDWQKVLTQKTAKASLYAVLIGTCKTMAVPELVAAIHNWQKGLVIILTSSNNELSDFPDESKPYIIEVEDFSVNSQLIQQVLVQAQNSMVEKSGKGTKNITQVKQKNQVPLTTGKGLFRSLVGESKEMQDLRRLIQQVADKPVNVLILGESGTGKEVIARNLHYYSERVDFPFVPVNCIAFRSERFELELFGFEAGKNSTKASQPGFFEEANDGTLFLDEVSDMPLEIQGKIMDFLETGTFKRVGGNSILHSNVKIIASTNKNLEDKIVQGMFREDLYYRLSVIPIKVPALKDHVADIPDLVSELVSRSEHLSNKSIRFNTTALLSLQRHSWPGNVRELMNLVERLAIIQPNDVLGVNDLPLEYQHIDTAEVIRLEKAEKKPGKGNEQNAQFEMLSSMQNFAPLTEENLTKYLANFEKHMIHVAIEDAAGAIGFAAERLGLDEEALEEKIKLHSL